MRESDTLSMNELLDRRDELIGRIRAIQNHSNPNFGVYSLSDLFTELACINNDIIQRGNIYGKRNWSAK